MNTFGYCGRLLAGESAFPVGWHGITPLTQPSIAEG